MTLVCDTPLIVDLLKVRAHPLVDSLLVSFCCCHHIKVLQCLTDSHKNADIAGHNKNETDLSCEGSTTCGAVGGFAGTRRTLASLQDGGRPTFYRREFSIFVHNPQMYPLNIKI